MSKKDKKIKGIFQNWFKTSGLDRKTLAYLCNISESHLRKVMCGYVKPSKWLTENIKEKTNGFIQEEDFKK